MLLQRTTPVRLVEVGHQRKPAWGNVKPSGVTGSLCIKPLPVPPVEKLLSIHRPTLKIINDKPIELFVVEAVVDFAPLGRVLESEVELFEGAKISAIQAGLVKRT